MTLPSRARVVEWLSAELNVLANAPVAAPVELKSAELLDLIVGFELRFEASVSLAALSRDALSSCDAFVDWLMRHTRPSPGSDWLELAVTSSDVGAQALSLRVRYPGLGLKVAGNRVFVGLPSIAQSAAPGENRDDGSPDLFPVRGPAATFLRSALDDLYGWWDRQGAEPVWLSSLCSEAHNHPEVVASAHRGVHLSHAACLSLFDQLDTAGPAVFGGLATVHRREPLPTVGGGPRLESFTVAETVIVGPNAWCERRARELRDSLSEVLSQWIPDSIWRPASDVFVAGLVLKEELVVPGRDRPVAVASLNSHGSLFTQRRGLPGSSWCIGIGLERLAWAALHVEEQ